MAMMICPFKRLFYLFCLPPFGNDGGFFKKKLLSLHNQKIIATMNKVLICLFFIFVSIYADAQISIKQYYNLGVIYADMGDTANIQFSTMFRELAQKDVKINGIVACECINYTYSKYPTSIGFLDFRFKKPIGNFYHAIDVLFDSGEIITLTVLGTVKPVPQIYIDR